VWREGLLKRLEEDGIPTKIRKLVNMWYENVRCKVRVNDRESSWFESKMGVRQGDTLSPLLFNVYINGIVERVKAMGGGALVGEVRIPILMFADDMVLMAESEEELEGMMERVKDFCDQWRLEVNTGKTKVMVVCQDGGQVASVHYGDEELECVREFTYLGTMFTADGKWDREVERRVQAGRAALSSISSKIVWNKKVTKKVKKLVFEMMVKSRLMYGGEIWWASKAEMGKLETVQNDFIRWITGHTRRDRESAGKLRKEVGMKSLEDSLCCKRLDWLGHLTRMEGSRLVSKVWGAETDGKRARGRPRWTYARQEAEDVAKGGVYREEALERKRWKEKVEKIGTPQ